MWLCRALGEFATEAGMPQEKAGQLVNNFLSSLQTLDNTLISSLRNKTSVPDAADKEVEKAVQDLDRCALQAMHLSVFPHDWHKKFL